MAKDARRIAIVDDDPVVLRALSRVLRVTGFEVAAYESGRDFLIDLAEHAPDCLILDWHMPFMNGAQVQLDLARRNALVPAIVLTGDDTPEARALALSLGASAYLQKPAELKTLLRAISSAIASQVESP